jgi:pimeloyl-ACP methyl ester carboxylesterase
MNTMFSKLDCTPRWRERLPEITAPTLVVHGAADPFFPVGNAEALAKEIPGATLRVLDGVGAELPRRAHAEWPRRCSRTQRRSPAPRAVSH